MSKRATFWIVLGVLCVTVAVGFAQQPVRIINAANAVVAFGTGTVDATVPRTVTASDSPDVATLGATGDAAVTAGSTGSISGKMRTMSNDLGGSGGIKDSTDRTADAIESLNTNLVFDPCDDGDIVDSVNINLGAGTGNTTLRALETGVEIYVCGWVLHAGGAGVFQLIYGAMSDCASGETPKYTMRATEAGYGVSVPNGGATQFKVPVSNGLCLDRDTSLTISGSVTIARVTP